MMDIRIDLNPDHLAHCYDYLDSFLTYLWVVREFYHYALQWHPEPNSICQVEHPMHDKLKYNIKYLSTNSWSHRFHEEFQHIQGVQDQNFRIQIAITQKLWTWDPKLVKPKCVWDIYIFSQLLEPFAYNKYKNMKNDLNFQSCLRGLVDKSLGW